MKKILLFFFILLFMPLLGGRLSNPIGRYQKYQGYLNQLDLEVDAANDETRLIDLQRQIDNVFRDFVADFCYLESYMNDSDLKKMENDFSECTRKCEKRIKAWIHNRLYYSRRYNAGVGEISTRIRLRIPDGDHGGIEGEEFEDPLLIDVPTIDHWLESNINSLPNINDIANNNYSDLNDLD